MIMAPLCKRLLAMLKSAIAAQGGVENVDPKYLSAISRSVTLYGTAAQKEELSKLLD